jgi:hypothetical protein
MILLHQGQDHVIEPTIIQRLRESVQPIFIPAEVEVVDDRENVNFARRHIVGDTQLSWSCHEYGWDRRQGRRRAPTRFRCVSVPARDPAPSPQQRCDDAFAAHFVHRVRQETLDDVASRLVATPSACGGDKHFEEERSFAKASSPPEASL